MSRLEQVDPDIAKAIHDETVRQSRNLELIASENFVSEAVLEAVGSVMTNKYAEATQANVTTGAARSSTWPRTWPSAAPRSSSAPST